MRTFLIKLSVVAGACLAAWLVSGYQNIHDEKYLNIGAAFAIATFLGLFNSMPIGHGVGRFWRILWMPVKLMFFYAVFSTLGVLLILSSNDPMLVDSMRLTRSLGISILTACILALIEWYAYSGPATSYSPPEDDPSFTLNRVKSRISELAKGTAPKK